TSNRTAGYDRPPRLKAGGPAKGLFANLPEQGRSRKLGGTASESEAQSRESQQVTKEVRDLLEVGRATAGRVVTILIRRLRGDFPLPLEWLHAGVSEEFH